MSKAPYPEGGFGAWTPDELRPTFKEFSGVGSDAGAPPVTRFVRGVASLVRRREAVDSEGLDEKTLSVFLLATDAARGMGLSREPMLDRGATPIAGKIWFVNPPVAAGWSKPLESALPEDIFQVVTDELNLGDAAAVVVDPRLDATEIRLYPQGLNEPDAYELVRFRATEVDLPQVVQIIERVYNGSMITPDAQPAGNKLWQEASRCRPKRDAEHRIQAYLKPAFLAAFPTCRIYDEFAGVLGRADLHVEQADPINHEKVTYLVVLELKVLRSYSDGGNPYSEGKNKEWVEAGVKQAGLYRRERGHRVAALCCFDMREGDSGDACFEHVTDLAESLEAALERWFLYSSSAQCRDALAASTSPEEA